MKQKTYLFSNPQYHTLNTETPIFDDLEKSSICYHIKNNIALCPYQSSFSLFEGEPNNIETLNFINNLKSKVSKIQFTLPPLIYPLAQENLKVLLSSGFHIKKIEVSSFLHLKNDFEENIHVSKRKKLNRLDKQNIHSKLLNPQDLSDCYDIIAQNRKEKGFNLSVSKSKTQDLINAFPDNFILIGTYKNEQLIASSISIAVSETVIYQFYGGHLQQFDALSPLLSNYKQLHCIAKAKGFEILDFGTSAWNNTINRPLLQFKKELGCSLSKKYYLEYSY